MVEFFKIKVRKKGPLSAIRKRVKCLKHKALFCIFEYRLTQLGLYRNKLYYGKNSIGSRRICCQEMAGSL